jgi:hypothetical protein
LDLAEACHSRSARANTQPSGVPPPNKPATFNWDYPIASGGIFAPSMRGREGIRLACLAAVCALGVGACGGGERQDANEPEGTFQLEVSSATFPASQSIAEAAVLKIAVRNADQKALPNVAVTIQTKSKTPGGAAQAFAEDTGNPNLADPSRPVWILDKGPIGGDTAYTNTWALGRLAPGQTKTFEWHVTAVKAGDYTVDYSVSPGLNGRAKPAGSGGAGTFKVTIDDTPPDARVGSDGKVIRSKPSSG